MDNVEISNVMNSKMRSIIDNDRFNIPLFHATSTAFLPSILEHGLGRIDIAVDYRALELFELLVDLVETHLPDYGAYYIEQMKLILRQEQGTQWRHGGAFLTPSMSRAVKYAVNSHGSELLSIIHGVYEDVIKYVPGTEGIIDEFKDIKQIFALEHRPLLLVVDDVEMKNIRGEDGNEGCHTLNRFFSLLGDGSYSSEAIDDAGQQTNFQLVEPKEITTDSCFEIIFLRRDKLNPKYELKELA